MVSGEQEVERVIHEPVREDAFVRPVTPPLYQHLLLLLFLLPAMVGVTLVASGLGSSRAEMDRAERTAVAVWEAAQANARFAEETYLNPLRVENTLKSLSTPEVAEHQASLGLYRIHVGRFSVEVAYEKARVGSELRLDRGDGLDTGEYRVLRRY